MKKLIFTFLGIFFTMMLLVSTVSSSQISLGNVDVNTPINLIQTCGTCTYNNITSFVYVPASITILSNVQMTRSGSQYNYTAPPQLLKGEYNVNGVGDLNGVATSWTYKVYVGKTFTLAESIIYLFLVFLGLSLFILFLYYSIQIPFTNEKNTKGAITKITTAKYRKLLSFIFCFMALRWFMNLLSGIFLYYITFDLGYALVSYLYLGLVLLTLPVVVVIFGIMFVLVWLDVLDYRQIKKWGEAFSKNEY